MSVKSRLNSLKARIGGRINDTAFWGTALLMTGFVATTPAFSQKMSLNSSGEWSVSRISAEPGQGSKPYCVMARRFDNDVIMSIAKNEDGQRSLAIDFQTPRLAVDRTYQVVLNAGGDVARGFEVRPVTDKAFVIRFGQDYKFFDAIEQGSFMKVSYSGEELGFDTQSFGESRKRLNECLNERQESLSLASEGAGYGGQEVQAVKVSYSDGAGNGLNDIKPASGNVEVADENAEKASVQDELVKELRQKIASLEAENESLKARASERKGSYKKVSQLSGEVSSLKSALDNEQNRVKSLERQLEEAKSTTARYASLLENARADNDMLEKRLADVKGAGDKALKMEVRANDLQAENNVLKQRLADLKSLQVASEAREERIAGLRKLVVSMEEEISSLEKEKSNLEDMLADAGAAIATSAGDDIDQESALTSSDEMCLSSNNWNLEKATRRYQEAQREIQRLGNALRRQKQECRSEIRSIESQLFSPDVASSAQNERFIELRQRMMRLTDQMKKQRVVSKRRVMRLEEELGDASERLQRAESRVREVQAELRGTKEALKTAKAKELSLRSQLEDIKSDPVSLQSRTQPNSEEYESFASDKDVSRSRTGSSMKAEMQAGTSGITGDTSEKIEDDSFVRSDARPQSLKKTDSQGNVLPDTVAAETLTRGKLHEQSINKILDDIQVNLVGEIMEFPVFGASDKLSSYKWDTGSLLGGADLYKSLSAENFVSRSRNTCAGNFKVHKDYHAVSNDNDASLHIYKLSCDASGKSLSKSLILVEDPSGQLKVLSHEAYGDEQPILMRLHEKILSSFRTVTSS